MATVNSNLAAATGFAFVTLTSWSGDAVFTATPVAGDQIYYPDSLTVGSDGQVSGSDGNYTLIKINSTGSAEAITYNISTPVQGPSGSVNVTLAAASGFAFVTLTSWAGDAVFPATPVVGDQIYYPDSLTVGAAGQVTGSDGNYTLVKINASGAAEAITYNISNPAAPQGTVTISNVSVTVTTATVTFSYDDTDQTGFEYRLDAGSWSAAVSPQEITGLTAATQYALEVRAVNGAGNGTAASQNFTTASLSGTTVSAPFSAGAAYTTVTLGASPSQTYFGSFAVAPVENDQITTLTTDGTFDSSGNFSQGAAGDYTTYHTRYATGIIAAETVTVSGVGVTDTTPEPTDTVTFTFGGKTGPYTATYKGQSITIDSQDAASITINSWPSLQTFGDSSADYNTAYVFEITDTSDSSTLTVNITTVPKTGYDYHTITGSPWSADSLYDDDSGIADGHKHYGYFTNGSADNVTTAGVVEGVTDRATYDYWIYDGSNWGSSATETFKVLGPFLTTPLELVAGSETTSSVQLRFQADDGGSYRIVGVLQTDPAPTIAQILVGQNASGNAALGDSGVTVFSANTLTTDTITGLPAGSGLSFYIALEDSNSRTSSGGPVNATTTSVGTPPVWDTVPPDTTYNDGDSVSINLSTYTTGATSYSISGLSPNSGLVLDPVTGILSGTVNLFDASAGDGNTASYFLTATAINSSGSATSQFELSFYNRDLPVILSPIPDQTWSEVFVIPLNVNQYIDKETSYYLEIDNGAGYVDATATIATYGITFDTDTGAFGGTPNSTATANSPLLFRVRGINADGNGDFDSFSATVNAAQPPIFNGPMPSIVATIGVSVNYDVSAYFSLVVTYSLVGLPVGSGLAIDEATGVITGTPTSLDLAASPFTITVVATNTDGNAQGTIAVQVNDLTLPVLATPIPNVSATVGDTVTVDLANYFTGADSYALYSIPTSSGLSISGSVVSGVLNSVDLNASPYPVGVSATNTDGTTNASFSVTVAPSNGDLDSAFWDVQVSESSVIDSEVHIYHDKDSTKHYWIDLFSISSDRTATSVTLLSDNSVYDDTLTITGRGVNDEVEQDYGANSYAIGRLFGVIVSGGVAGGAYRYIIRASYASGETDDMVLIINVI